MRLSITMAALLLLAGLAGCAPTQVSPETAVAVPPRRIIDKVATTPAPGKVMLVVMRDKGGAPYVPFDPEIYVDGHAMARIGSGEILRMYLEPGQYELAVRRTGDADGRYATSIMVGGAAAPVYWLRWTLNGYMLEQVDAAAQ